VSHVATLPLSDTTSHDVVGMMPAPERKRVSTRAWVAHLLVAKSRSGSATSTPSSRDLLSRTTGTLAGVGDEGPDFCFDSLKAKRGSQRSAAEAATKQKRSPIAPPSVRLPGGG
jgi:hypothetical protein